MRGDESTPTEDDNRTTSPGPSRTSPEKDSVAAAHTTSGSRSKRDKAKCQVWECLRAAHAAHTWAVRPLLGRGVELSVPPDELSALPRRCARRTSPRSAPTTRCVRERACGRGVVQWGVQG